MVAIMSDDVLANLGQEPGGPAPLVVHWLVVDVPAQRTLVLGRQPIAVVLAMLPLLALKSHPGIGIGLDTRQEALAELAFGVLTVLLWEDTEVKSNASFQRERRSAHEQCLVQPTKVGAYFFFVCVCLSSKAMTNQRNRTRDGAQTHKRPARETRGELTTALNWSTVWGYAAKAGCIATNPEGEHRESAKDTRGLLLPVHRQH